MSRRTSAPSTSSDRPRWSTSAWGPPQTRGRARWQRCWFATSTPFVKEAPLTSDEWMAGIRCLTEPGQMCTDWGQEFILLFDVLGVSVLVHAINRKRPGHATENTVLDPFYVPDAPRYPKGVSICMDGKGSRCWSTAGWSTRKDRRLPARRSMSGRRRTTGSTTCSSTAQPDFNLRGVFTSEADGHYWFRSVTPRHYPIPDDGPVGHLLTALDRHPNRAAPPLHRAAAWYEDVVTHIFPPDCTYLAEDAVFGVTRSLIADFRRIDDVGRGACQSLWEVMWEFVLVRKAG